MWAPTGTEASQFDQEAIERRGVPQVALMESAGRSAAHVLDRLYPRGLVVAVVGAGNNGGDALVLLRTLKSWGRSVRAILAADRMADDPLLHGWDVEVGTDDGFAEGDAAGMGSSADKGGFADKSGFADAAVIVDGVLGTGIHGPPRPRQAAAIRAINRSGVPVVALDAPSGVDTDTGQVAGDAVVADVTVALGWPKLGTLLQPARSKVGRLIAVEIGFPPLGDHLFGAMVVTPEWVYERRPTRDAHAHKNQVGALLLVAGGSGMAGAAVLAGKAALRAGVGLLRVVSSGDNREIIQTSIPEAIFIPPDHTDEVRKAALASDAVAAGPGLGTSSEAVHLLEFIQEATPGLPAVLDADALNCAVSGQGPTIERWSDGRDTLITPHLGEMGRLMDLSSEAISADRVSAARALSSRTGASVLLKGLPSIVAHGTGPCWIDAVGTSDLAAGGMGDVLTGVAGSLLAQGTRSDVAGALALHGTGRAAILAAKGASLMPSDVIEALPDALREAGASQSDLGLPFVLFDQNPAR